VLKKFLVVVGFALSPFVSLVLFTPITMIPALLLSSVFTRNECANVQGESLCGMGIGMFIGFIFNATLGLCLTIYINWKIKNSWVQKNKINISILLSIYFILVTILFLYFSAIKPGFLN
jgi:uncharacterized protein (DUF2062 family)